MIFNHRRLIKLMLFSIVNFFIYPSLVKKKKAILIIRLDLIGDYVLFRNFLKILHKSKKYSNYKITMLGNNSWCNLCKELDYKYIDEFIWLDRKQFNGNLLYRFKKLREITSNAYEIVINPTYSREFFYSDTVVKLVNADKKIGSTSDLSNQTSYELKVSDKYYTKLIPAKKEVMFEFNRNKEFFELLLENKINLSSPTIFLDEKETSLNLPKKYAVIFIGASSKFKKWDVKKFSLIALHLIKKYKHDIVLCGGPNDLEELRLFRNNFKWNL